MRNKCEKNMIKFLIGGTIFATLASLVSFATILFNVDPSSPGSISKAVFYGSLFFCLLGTLFIGMIYLRKRRNRETIEEIMHAAFRQSFFTATFLVSLLFLRQSNMLNIISGVCLIVFVLALEVYFSKMIA